MYRSYDRYFARLLWKRLQERRRVAPDAATVVFQRRPRGIYEFDDVFTAPVCGFGTADNYYRQCSSLPLLSKIALPAMILAAEDDPLVLAQPLLDASLSSSTRLHLARHGGHLGFVSRRGVDPDRSRGGLCGIERPGGVRGACWCWGSCSVEPLRAPSWRIS